MNEPLVLNLAKPKDVKILTLWCHLRMPLDVKLENQSWARYRGSPEQVLSYIQDGTLTTRARVRLAQ